MRRHDCLSESKVTKACRYVKDIPTRFFLSLPTTLGIKILELKQYK